MLLQKRINAIFSKKAVYANTLDATELWQDFEGKQWFEQKAFQNLE